VAIEKHNMKIISFIRLKAADRSASICPWQISLSTHRVVELRGGLAGRDSHVHYRFTPIARTPMYALKSNSAITRAVAQEMLAEKMTGIDGGDNRRLMGDC
jgi:hypothetical protein